MDPIDRDLIARTVVGEAANQPFEGQQAVAAVILNRLNSGRFGKSISDVVFAPSQFEPWQTRRGELEAIKPDSPAYVRAAEAIDAALRHDNTAGATHFLQPDIVMQRRGGTLPNWAQGPSQRVGDHLFFRPEGGGPTGTATKSPVNTVPYAGTPTQVPPSGGMADAFASVYPDEGELPIPLVKAPQIGLYSPQQGDDDASAALQPRTSRRPNPLVRRA